MTQEHPITPPPELVQQWSDIEPYPLPPPDVVSPRWRDPAPAPARPLPPSLRRPMKDAVFQNWVKIAAQAAQWGADQELEACCEWMRNAPFGLSLNTSGNQLRTARRPKPPSLKEQALDALNLMLMFIPPGDQREQGETIRKALEALDD